MKTIANNIYRKIMAFFGTWPGKALLMALLPLLCCAVTCAVQGYTISDVYLPASPWNDELFYFKQVEAIVNYGYPQGYFGFNESHALKLSFAAWSPVLVFPWVLWGLVFGWNLMSPIWCNLFLLSAAIAAFVLLAKPSRKQLGILAVLYCAFPLFTRYILSGMPEVICFSMLIVFYGVAVNYLRKPIRGGGQLSLLFAMAVLMTWMRPYLIVFLLLPIFLWIRKYRKWWCVAGSLAVIAGTFGVYGLISYYLSAEYLTPLFDTRWIMAFLNDGLLEGVRFTLGTLWYSSQDFWARVVEAYRSGMPEGAFFVAFLTALGLLAIHTVRAFRKKNAVEWILGGHGVVAFIGMWMALLLMYGMKDGSKHMLTFVVVGIFLIAVMETKRYLKPAMLVITFVWFFYIKATNPYDYQIPFTNPECEAQMEYWEETFRAEMPFVEENTPNYDNVTIWVLDDFAKEGDTPTLTQWQALYFIPKGMGISCCYRGYVLDNIDSLKSRYVATFAGGIVDHTCSQAGFPEIGRLDELVVYRAGY